LCGRLFRFEEEGENFFLSPCLGRDGWKIKKKKRTKSGCNHPSSADKNLKNKTLTNLDRATTFCSNCDCAAWRVIEGNNVEYKN
jgi:hypothetical protein